MLGKPGSQIHAAQPDYRADIDGLRAIAVLVVIFYHAGILGVSGGYVGVDIFFVISGYLITSLLYKEMSQQRFSLLEFYARRVRRIFPAMTTIFLGSVVAGFFLLFPQQYLAFGEAGRELSTISVNHTFLRAANDYWRQTQLITEPLLHTWSLAIEEQFYLAFPLLLVLLFYLGRCFKNEAAKSRFLFTVLSVLLAISFALNIFFIDSQQPFAFYSLPTRAWELLLGAVLSLWMKDSSDKAQSYPWKGFVPASAQVLMLCLFASVFYLNEQSRYPGWNALLPCTAASLAIYLGQLGRQSANLTRRTLETKPIVFVGKLSFSLYLWHWPVLVFMKSPTALLKGFEFSVVLYLVITFALSYLTWRWIEEPFRRGRLAILNPRLAIGAGLICLLSINLAARIVVSIGEGRALITQTVPQELMDALPNNRQAPFRVWQSTFEEIIASGGAQSLGLPSVTKSVAIMGDSTAGMWGTGLDELFQSKGKSAWMLAREGCPVLDNLASKTEGNCFAATEARLKFVENSGVRKVVLVNHWMGLEEKFFIQEDSSAQPFTLEILKKALQKTIERLQKRKFEVYLVHSVPGDPQPRVSFERAIASLRQGGEPIYGWAEKDQLSRGDFQEMRTLFLQLKAQYGIKILDPADLLCSSKGCLVAEGGKPIYVEGFHLGNYGSKKFARMFDAVFD